MIDLFPYAPRPCQVPILRDARHVAQKTGGTLLLDAPTGTGKTVAVLAPLLEHALASTHKILYLVRTHSQAAQVVREVRAIARRSGMDIPVVTLEGREGRCPLMDGGRVTRGANAEEYGKLCSDHKRATVRNLGRVDLSLAPLEKDDSLSVREIEGCPYYAANLSRGTMEAREHIVRALPIGSDFTKWAREQGYCPYEMAKSLAREAKVVIAPYVTFFHPSIRESLLGWLGSPLEEIDLVIDEAHNLPENLRELSSSRLTVESVERAIREVSVQGGFTLSPGVEAGYLLQRVAEAVRTLSAGLPTGEEEGLLPEGALEEQLLGGPLATSARWEHALHALAVWGDELRESRRQNHLIPRSYAYNCAVFLLGWSAQGPPSHVKVITGEPTPALELYSLDATERAEAATRTHLTVHMSGTLAPLEDYRDSLGLPSTARLLEAPPAFPPEHRRLFCSGTATSRFHDLEQEGGIDRLKEEIIASVRALPVKTAVFFPSFGLLTRMIEQGLVNDLEEIGCRAVIEERGLSTEDLWRLVDGFKRSTGARVILGVCGGRISEGIDFPSEELGGVILAGVPYPRPSARREALSRFLDRTIGNGWEHCFAAPARRAMLQALGRMIRSEEDRGIGVLLDHRAIRFRSALGPMEPLDDLASQAKNFFSLPPSTPVVPR